MTTTSELATLALRAALEARSRAGIRRTAPVCPYDLCEDLGIRVQFFAGASFEGMYCREKRTIMVPAERPRGRRTFACAHEFGHDYFGHGTVIDSPRESGPLRDPRERLVDLFGGYLLMPKGVLLAGAATLELTFKRLSSRDAYRLSSWLGVGYSTLVGHLERSMRFIDSGHAADLLHCRPSEIRSELLEGAPSRDLLVAAPWVPPGPVDLEVGDSVLAPHGVSFPTDRLELTGEVEAGAVLRPLRPGIARLTAGDDWSAVCRTMMAGFTGWSRNRFLDDPNDD